MPCQAKSQRQAMSLVWAISWPCPSEFPGLLFRPTLLPLNSRAVASRPRAFCSSLLVSPPFHRTPPETCSRSAAIHSVFLRVWKKVPCSLLVHSSDPHLILKIMSVPASCPPRLALGAIIVPLDIESRDYVTPEVVIDSC